MPDGVTIAIEGLAEQQEQFLNSLDNHLPPFAEIRSKSITRQALAGFRDFQIKPSVFDGEQSAFVLPDIATCQDCIGDLFDPKSRYYNYPFTSCCHCGPRYSIMVRQPYDRAHTSMAAFKPCHGCEQDYQAIANRRFHAQAIACPNCGPQLLFLDDSGNVLEEKHGALLAAIQQLRSGKIVAIKGIGGYQLLVDAANQDAIERLRQRKRRPQKPFALMVADLESALNLCVINGQEKSSLLSPEAPIVLLKRREGAGPSFLSKAVSPGNNLLGVMLPYSPLHHLLLDGFGSPLVATSGNRQNEPICMDEDQALMRLLGIADYFLTHNRTILRPLDDSIVRFINGKMTVLRRARGYTPFPVTLKTRLPDTLALGGQLKNTVAICRDQQIILSQHLGDLDSEASQEQYRATMADLQAFYRIKPVCIMHDLHKGYVSTQLSEELTGVKQPVQHHYAHALSCMAEHGLEPPLLAVIWDGSGLGDDNTLWGGEFLLVSKQGYQRFAHFRPFSLPGGVRAIQEPRRSALGLLFETFGDRVFGRPNLAFTDMELKFLQTALNKNINCPKTTSVGRLFDAVASLLGLCHINHYEGQAAMALENCASSMANGQHYPFQLSRSTPIVINWENTLEHLLEDITSFSPQLIAVKFHNTLAEMILAVANKAGFDNIVMSGGCFQNALLVEKAANKLNTAGFNVYCHEKIPPNDGGLALGQAYAAKYMG